MISLVRARVQTFRVLLRNPASQGGLAQQTPSRRLRRREMKDEDAQPLEVHVMNGRGYVWRVQGAEGRHPGSAIWCSNSSGRMGVHLKARSWEGVELYMLPDPLLCFPAQHSAGGPAESLICAARLHVHV